MDESRAGWTTQSIHGVTVQEHTNGVSRMRNYGSARARRQYELGEREEKERLKYEELDRRFPGSRSNEAAPLSAGAEKGKENLEKFNRRQSVPVNAQKLSVSTQEGSVDVDREIALLRYDTERVLNEGRVRITDPGNLTDDPYLKTSKFGIGFYLLVAVALATEIIEIILGVLELVGWVTIVIGVAIHLIVMLLSTIVAIGEMSYFFTQSAPRSGKGAINTNLRILSSLAGKYIPVVGDFIPFETITLVITGFQINKRVNAARALRKQELAQMQTELDEFEAGVFADYEARLAQLV